MTSPSPKKIKQITIYSDGACSGNPGPGGWAALLIYGGREKMMSGHDEATTNNRMELMAAIKALEALKEPCDITFYTDSQYVQNGMTQWVEQWKKNNWRNKDNEPVKNIDLWQTLDKLATTHYIFWQWIKGHNNHPIHDRVDEAARKAAKQQKRLSGATGPVKKA